MTTPPYPEVTLDTFGFPVGARLAARRAVLWPQLPKVALLGPKNALFLTLIDPHEQEYHHNHNNNDDSMLIYSLVH